MSTPIVEEVDKSTFMVKCLPETVMIFYIIKEGSSKHSYQISSTIKNAFKQCEKQRRKTGDRYIPLTKDLYLEFVKARSKAEVKNITSDKKTFIRLKLDKD